MIQWPGLELETLTYLGFSLLTDQLYGLFSLTHGCFSAT